MSDLRAYQKYAFGESSLVLSDETSRDAAQISGRWIASTDFVEVKQ